MDNPEKLTTRQKHNKLCVWHHYAQTHTNNVNKPWAEPPKNNWRYRRTELRFCVAEMSILPFSTFCRVDLFWRCTYCIFGFYFYISLYVHISNPIQSYYLCMCMAVYVYLETFMSAEEKMFRNISPSLE